MANFEFELIEPHQSQFVNSQKRFCINSGGVGSGKSYSIVLKALKLIVEYPNIFGLIGASTYPLLRDTILREFINLFPPQLIKNYNKSLLHFEFINGAEVIFRSFDDANKLKSLNLGFCGIDEMTDIDEEIFKMLRTRMRQKDMPCSIFGATNPSTLENWVYKYFIEHPIHDSEIIYSKTSDNFYLPNEFLKDLESMKETNPEYYDRMVLGKWGNLEGLIYYMPMSQRIPAGELPNKFDKYIAGLDFGYTHPTCLIILGVLGDKFFVVDEVYKRKMISSEIIDVANQKVKEYGIKSIYCDSARPEIIEDLKRAELPAKTARKDVFDGIMWIKSLIGEKNLFVNKDCIYTLKEFDSYVWDKRKSDKEMPIKINDDALDALRYAIYSDVKLARRRLKNISFVSMTRSSPWFSN